MLIDLTSEFVFSLKDLLYEYQERILGTVFNLLYGMYIYII